MRTLPLVLCAALGLAGCSRDLEIPELGGPSLSTISPGRAFAGEWVAIAGSGFAGSPDGNLVQFAAAAARGEAFDDAGALLVRVPADAGSGTITVTTSAGASQPGPRFEYLGLGQLRANQVTGRIDLLHKPYRVLASGGETFIDSDLVVGLVRYGDPGFVAALAQSSVALPSADAIAWYEADGDTATLVRKPLPTGALTTASVTSGQSVHLVAMRTPDRVAVVRRERRANPGAVPPVPYAPPTVTVHDATTLAVTTPASTLPFPIPHGCDDAGSGRLACVTHADFEPASQLALVTPGQVPVSTAIAPPAAIHHNDFDLEEDDPLCVATVAGQRVAVAGLEDGRLLVANLDVAPVTFTYASTASATPAQSLTCPGGSAVLVAKTGDDLLLSVDVASRTITWAASVPRAARMGVEDGVVHVAGDADNVVELRSLATGQLLGRRAFDPLPGRDDGLGVQGATWVQEGFQGVPVLDLVTGSPRGLVEVPVQATNNANAVYPIYLDIPDAIGVIPGALGGYLALRDEGLGNFDLGHPVQLGQDSPSHYYAGTDDGLVTVVFPSNDVVLSPFAGAEFRSMGLLDPGCVPPGCRLWAAVHRQTGPTTFENAVRLWTEADAIAGRAATATWLTPGGGFIDGAAVLNGSLWAFYWDGEQDHAVELSSSLSALRDVPLGDYLLQVLAASPNGRTLVSWESQPFSENTSIVVRSAEPGAAFPRVATIPIDGQVTGAAFDGTGEKLYVLATRPGRIVVIQ